ncbi:unnamed protein product [Mytilus coruscus]|uniref:WSC domain-containing protein n=1 Tax=Mytilus coruscus TaxID=42192 RepID=A0A6J8C164_MYTCO|nr:unnamed protein product [Mytilus coruscus]
MGNSSEDEVYTDAGCYENKVRERRNRLLSDGPYSDNPMSAVICYKKCTKGTIRDRFNYFGTQNRSECYCGEVANIDSHYGLKQSKSECNRKCNGNKDEKCGSKHNASLYRLKVRPMLPSTNITATSLSSLTTTQLPREDPGFKASSASERGDETTTAKGVLTNPANNVSLAGIGIGVAVIACLIFVAICCILIWRRRKQNRDRSNTYRNAEDINVTTNQNLQRQGNSFSYTELIVYNNNHAYDDLRVETNDTFNGPGNAESLDISESLSHDNYTVLVVPEDQNEGTNSTIMTNTTGVIENISDKKALNKTNTTIGAYAILDPRATGFDRTKPEQKIKADSYAVLDPAETGFDRTKDRDDIPTQSVKHENSDKAMRNGGTHSITMTNTIDSNENKAAKKAPKKTNNDIGAYAILDPDATGFDRTKPEQKVNADSYAVFDPAETGFDRTTDREDMPSQSAKTKTRVKLYMGTPF